MGRNGCNLFKFAWLGLLCAFILGSVSTCWRALEAIEAIWGLGLKDYRFTFRAHQQFQIIAKTNTGKQLEDGHNLLICNIRKESNVITVLDTPFCANQESDFHLGEDYALAFCASWFGPGSPYRTIDGQGRKRFIPHYAKLSPENLCSIESIAFHDISPDLMRDIHLELTECREEQNLEEYSPNLPINSSSTPASPSINN